MSVSVTTRKPRPGEREGRDYFFVSHDDFERMREAGELLEWAEVFGNYYGTPRAPVEQVLGEGRDILFDVDWQGAAQLAKTCGDELCRVFILPPSGAVLGARLRGRGTDDPKTIADRMEKAAGEISHWREYDYVIINDELDIAQQQLNAILLAERQRRRRLTGLEAFVDEIIGDL